ncbi:MAG TPA: sodium transporter, partial [Dialister sp.]|nr:sodium transporter [Dialister sp.]
VVVLFNALGYVLGLCVAKLCGLSWKKAVTLSVEVGMQNSGLATGLAKVHFASMPAAVVPGAIFSAWFTISGAVLAWACVNYLNPKYGEEEVEEEETVVNTVAAN